MTPMETTMLSGPPIAAKLSVKFSRWQAPNFAILVGESEAAIPVRDLSDDALEDLALAWLGDLYTAAGRRYCPFHKSTPEAPRKGQVDE
jgi:hypothetical protein